MGKKKGGGASGGSKVDPAAAQAAIDAATGDVGAESREPVGSSDELVTMYDKGGRAVSVPQSQASQAYSSGQYGFADGQTVHVRDEHGRVFEMDAAEAPQALSQGYGLASKGEIAEAKEKQEYNTVGKTAKAFGSGVLSGASFGLSDAAIAEMGGREELQKLEKHHGLARGVGTAVGAIAPTLVSGGAGAAVEGAEGAAALGRVGEAATGLAEAGTAAREAGLASRTIGTLGAAPRGVARLGELAAAGTERVVGKGATSILGKIAQRATPLAAQGATEGAFYGAGQEISEAALGDHELTAEKLLAGAGKGALLGAAGGAVMGAGEVAGRAAADKAFQLAGEKGLDDWLQTFANNRTIKALGASQRDIHRLGRTGEEAQQRLGEISETVRGYRFGDGEKLFKPTSSVEDLAKGTRRALDEQTGKLDTIRKTVAKTIDKDPALAPDLPAFFSKVDADLADLKVSNVAAIRNRADRVENEIAALRNRMNPVGLAEDHPAFPIWKAAQEGNPGAQRAIDSLKARDPSFAAMLEPKPVTIEELTQTRKDLDRIIYPKTNSGVPPPAPEHQAELLKVRGALEETIENATEKAAKASGDPKLYADYLATKKQIHDLIPANQMAERWVTRDIGNRAVSPTDYLTGGLVGHALAGAGHGLLGPVGGVAMAAAHHWAREHGSGMLAVAADKLAQFSAIRRATIDVDRRIDQAVSRLIVATPKGSPPAKPEPKPGSFGKTAAKLIDKQGPTAPDEIGSSASKHFERVAKFVAPISVHAPGVAAALSSKSTTMMDALKQRMPGQGIKENTIQPQFDKPRVSATDRVSYEKYAAALEDPVGVLERPTRDGVRAVKENLPKLFADMQDRVTKAVAGAKNEIPYAKLQELSILFDTPLHPTQTPEFRASIQQMYADTAKDQQQSKKGPGARRPAKSLGTGAQLPIQQIDQQMA
jgi:hypothetical protein